ncbi:auxin-repressed protein-like protein [Carex littledalei]|uniref:Auxin-repressed protein-like protein n=1 Tax=Carex littledalei TaxID=544730 RepID=A0A833VGP5_9POAL|nr:auxin-repressed protein-like protein [Carex littledalei]
MSLLDHLWDETVAGPTPDSGLGKLRKHSSFNQTGTSSWSASGGSAPALTRSLTFLRTATSPNGYSGDSGTGSGPASPASVPGSPSPLSPSTPTSDWRTARRKQRAMAESTDAVIQPRNPTVYDW